MQKTAKIKKKEVTLLEEIILIYEEKALKLRHGSNMEREIKGCSNEDILVKDFIKKKIGWGTKAKG